MKPKIIQNYLTPIKFTLLRDTIFSSRFPWFYQANVAKEDEAEKHTFGFTHMFYFGKNAQSQHLEILQPLLSTLKIKTLIRAKANFYPNQGIQRTHPPHIDFSYPHKGFLLSLNTTDGYTQFMDGTRVIGKENQAMVFDPSVYHFSSTPTDTKRRINIQINYIENEN
jgi:hypothetical protein|tara:strand:- start:48 stop:548 length:501 start_codon:yes stop_codon:yes gene_type:complete